jgi:hypothetical protein
VTSGIASEATTCHDLPGDHRNAEHREHVHPAPLGAARQPEAHPGQHLPRPENPQTVESVRHPVVIGHQASDRADDPERQEPVEQGEPGHHDVHAVEGEQEAGEAADDRRSGEAPHQSGQHQHRERADDRGRDAPAERIHPERRLAERDEPFAGLGVHDLRGLAGDEQVGEVSGGDALVGSLDVVLGVAGLEHRPRLLGVVRLVEGQ